MESSIKLVTTKKQIASGGCSQNEILAVHLKNKKNCIKKQALSQILTGFKLHSQSYMERKINVCQSLRLNNSLRS